MVADNADGCLAAVADVEVDLVEDGEWNVEGGEHQVWLAVFVVLEERFFGDAILLTQRLAQQQISRCTLAAP